MSVRRELYDLLSQLPDRDPVQRIVGLSRYFESLPPNEVEVAEVVEIGVRDLLEPATRSSHRVRRGALVFRAPHFAIGTQHIWGATSLVLAEFAELAARASR